MIPADVMQGFAGARIVVTGGTGLIGRQVVQLLCKADASVVAASLDKIKVDEHAKHVYGDLTDFNFCKQILGGADFVCHLAGIKGSIDVSRRLLANHFVPTLMMNTNVLEAARLSQVKKLVYTSSIGAYHDSSEAPCGPDARSAIGTGLFAEPGDLSAIAQRATAEAQNASLSCPSSSGAREDLPSGKPQGFLAKKGAFIEHDIIEEMASQPMDFAGWAKRVGELQLYTYMIQYGLTNFAVVRPANVYGPGDNFDPANAMVIPSLIARIARGEKPLRVWGDGSAVRDFVFSRDVAEGIILALHYGTGGGYVNLGGGQGVSIQKLVETLHEIVNFDHEFDVSKPSGPSRKIMNISKARHLIGYEPTTSLKDGLRQTWEWFTNNRSEYIHKKNYFIQPGT